MTEMHNKKNHNPRTRTAAESSDGNNLPNLCTAGDVKQSQPPIRPIESIMYLLLNATLFTGLHPRAESFYLIGCSALFLSVTFIIFSCTPMLIEI